MSIALSSALSAELEALGAAGRRRAAASAAAMFAGDVSAPAPAVDPVPVVLDADEWERVTAGLAQRLRLLDALYADLYGARSLLTREVAPVDELLRDPAYLRGAVGMPSREGSHLFSLACTVTRTRDGAWVAVEDSADVPDGAGIALELRRALSRCAPSLYRSTALRRLHPFFDIARTALHQRVRTRGRAGRTVVLTDAGDDPLRAFDHHWIANLLGAPVVSAGDLRAAADGLRLRPPGPTSTPEDAVDGVLRLLPSALLDPLDLGPTPRRGVAGLTETARCGDLEILNPLGAGVLEGAALREALPDLCRRVLHEDLLLRPAPASFDPAPVPSLDPEGGDRLVERPVSLRLLVVRTATGFEVMPGGAALTTDPDPTAMKDVWVRVPESSAAPDRPMDGDQAGAPAAAAAPRRVLAAYPAMTRSTGSDLFWFGRYLERVDFTARLLRTVLDTTNDLDAERSPSARDVRSVLLRAVTAVTTTHPGFDAVDLADPAAVRDEVLSLLVDASRPGSLAQSFRALSLTTRTLRDLISEDIWPVITGMRQHLHGLGGDSALPLEQGLTAVVDGCLTFSGAIADSMPRTVGWDLTEAGRKLERTMGVLALLRAALGHRRSRTAEARVVGAIAAVTESDTSYRRSYHAAFQPELLLELLLRDTTLPRSLAFQLERLGLALDRLPEAEPSAELRVPLTALRGRLTSWEPRELLQPAPQPDGQRADGAPTPLLEEAAAAMETLRELATAIEERFFRPSESTSHWGVDDV